MRRRSVPPLQLALLLVATAPALLAKPTGGFRWPAVFDGAGAALARTADQCRAAAGGHVYPDQTVMQPLAEWMGLEGPVLRPPDTVTDVTTLNTLVQLATPGLQLVLDPLLYLDASPEVFADSNGGSELPKLIHMTMKSKHRVPPHQVLSILSWGRFNKGYTLLMYDDTDMRAYVEKYFPDFLPTFEALKTPVEKSDAWRYHVLCGHGGIYADTDTACVAPFDEWAQRVRAGAAQREGRDPFHHGAHEAAPGLVVGIENVFRSQEEAEEMTYVKKIQMIQWTMAAKKGHPAPCRMGEMIKQRLHNESLEAAAARIAESRRAEPGGRRAPGNGGAGGAADGGGGSGGGGPSVDDLPPLGQDARILLRTGPGIWSDCVHDYIREVNSTPEALALGGQAGDVLVLPQMALGCSIRFWHKDNKAAFAYHMYNNSWKQDHFKVANARKEARRLRRRKQRMQRVMWWLLAACAAAVGGAAAYFGLELAAPGAVAGLLRRDKRRRVLLRND